MMPLNNIFQDTKNTNQKSYKKNEIVLPKPKKKTKFTKEDSLNELCVLIECLGFGHKKFLEFPQYNITNSSELKPRIYRLIYKLVFRL